MAGGRPIGKLHQDDVRTEKFFVYVLTDQDGNVAYVGKGSGRRAKTSARKRGLSIKELIWFKSESAALKKEVRLIAKLNPYQNKCAGGNGSKVKKVVQVKTSWQKTVETIGSRRYSAMLWLAYATPQNSDWSKYSQIREIAYGKTA